MIFTFAIVDGQIGNRSPIDGRFGNHDYRSALEAWDRQGEPQGWRPARQRLRGPDRQQEPSHRSNYRMPPPFWAPG
jgi:hypothetical protein